MYVELTPDGGLEAIDKIGQWLLDYGGISGRLHAQLAVVKIISRFGEGTYRIKDKGKLYKGSEMVVHRDDVKEFVMGKEIQLKKGKEPEKEIKEPEKEVKEEKAPVGGESQDRRRARKKSNPWTK